MSVDNQILAVFICNICGSFILATAIELRTKIRSELESLVSIGFCGGLSIFASFSRDSVAALRAENFSLFFINLSANFILCVCAVLAAQFLAEKLRYISAYLKDSEESQKYDSATGKIFDAIRHSFSRPNIEKIPTISERAMVQPRTPGSSYVPINPTASNLSSRRNWLNRRGKIMNSVAVAILCVVSGGSLGALLRFTLAKNFDASASGFPFGTFAANMLASFLLGLFSALANAEELSRTAEIFLDTGFCATLSTFSTLAWQIADMLKKRRLLLCSLYFTATFSMGMALFLLAEELAG